MTHARRGTVRGLAALLVAAVIALAAAAALAAPKQWDEDWCKQSWGDGGRARVCEVRELTMSRLPTALSVTPGDNGGVEVAAGSPGAVRVKARVEAWGKTEAEAEALLLRIRIVEDQDRLSVDGPVENRLGHVGPNWSVSFRIEAPASTALELRTLNGPLAVYDMTGRMLLTTTNGPMAIVGGGGDVEARTENGPLSVVLKGTRWAGRGLEARAVNGPVSISIPRVYNAGLEYGTVNGPWSGPRPAISNGRNGGYAHVRLGKGGAPLSVTTENGPFDMGHARDDRE
jgi:hypothetical protein